jgi:hypothetical protein
MRLWSLQTAEIRAAVIDENGNVLDRVLVQEGNGDWELLEALIPLGGNSALALYHRFVNDAPYRGTIQTFARVLTVSDVARRRSARH